MRSVYKVLAYVVAAEVVIQAMAIVYAVAGEGRWVMEGGVLDKAVIESRAFVFPEVLGFAIHGINGTMIIPLLALLLLIFSFFTKVPRGREVGGHCAPARGPTGDARHRGPLHSGPGCVAWTERTAAVQRGRLYRTSGAPCNRRHGHRVARAHRGAGLDEAPMRRYRLAVHIGGPTGVVLGSRSYQAPAAPRPAATLDLLTYGTATPLGFDPNRPDRRFRYDIGRRPGFIDGRPGLFWTVHGRLYPDVPMFVVAEGDVVRVGISNHSGDVHPMHLHGHHAVVLSRNGVSASGSPWWVDSLNVADGESYDIAFVADHPGIWMDHCHNLTHAADGLVAHLMYQGITTPYLVGGAAANTPE